VGHEEQLELEPPEAAPDTIASIAASAVRAPDGFWDAASDLASQISGKALIPVLGAGASYPCRVPLAGVLGRLLVEAVRDGRIRLAALPSDYESFNGARDCRPPDSADLGRMADLVCLERGPSVVLEELGFMDADRWPGGEALAKEHATSPHHCAYRILARMTRERFFAEALTFNYDCHFEGALLKEGFQTNARRRTTRLWPERFDVVADAATNANLLPRGDFVLNKVHGCVKTWRDRRATLDPGERANADDAIVIRWTQLLDWRGDFWARDLFRDRARRHVLLLIGFSGNDAVIHSSLRSVLKEIRAVAEGPELRVRVIDVAPDTLTLRLLVDAGRGPGAHGQVEQLSVGAVGLAETLLIIHTQLLKLALIEEARAQGRPAAIATARREALLQLGVAAPAMMRWTTALLQGTGAARPGAGSIVDEFRNNLYVPLRGDPARSLQLLETETHLRQTLGVAPPADDPLRAAGFYRRPRDVRAFLPTGLEARELRHLAQEGELRNIAARLAVPKDLSPVAVAAAEGGLQAYSVETGERVPI
jgi:SIR2-like domain